jgi:hypothetical protein
MAILGLIIAVAAIGVSVRAAVIAQEAAHSQFKEIALSLSTDVEISSIENDDTSKRWKFNPLGQPESISWTTPGHAAPGEEYVVPANENLFMSVTCLIQFENLGPRKAFVTIGSDYLVEFFQDKTFEFTTLTSERRLPNRTFELERNSIRTIYVYAGETVGEFFKRGATPGAQDFEIPVSANAGPDSANQSWTISINATLFDPTWGNASGARVVPSIAPITKISSNPRKFPDLPRGSYFRKFFLGSQIRSKS